MGLRRAPCKYMSSRPPLIAAFAGLDPRGLLESSNEGDTTLGWDWTSEAVNNDIVRHDGARKKIQSVVTSI